MGEFQELLRGVIHPWHHDHFGHMNVRHYAPFFDDAAYHLWTVLDISYKDMMETHGIHCVTAQATTNFIRELEAGDLIRIDGAVTRVGTKSVSFHLRMFNADTGLLHATYDMVEVFFDPEHRRSTFMPPEIRAELEDALVELD
ncbi:acyl-CoA thioesterase [Mangrovicoccus algicola]|uniref:Acyl-CoA thioesterase n=1 Tax=Mangrovicoccus algicola TaxID=2771008 RepID=A0A8J6Z963_9RHOB|nr:thioesterase family protein [Mangrovicoccus algicola]MBE3638246.1 acyl-CoA thioesterase [Mangrovicoccus algicola]